MIEDEKLQEIAMTIIANAGAAKGSAFGALESAKGGDFPAAQALLGQAEETLHLAQDAHRNLLQMDAAGLVPQVDILLSHAQDHFMMATLATELIAELVTLYQRGTTNGKES